MRVTDEVENVRLNQTFTEQHSLTVRARSVTDRRYGRCVVAANLAAVGLVPHPVGHGATTPLASPKAGKLSRAHTICGKAETFNARD